MWNIRSRRFLFLFCIILVPSVIALAYFTNADRGEIYPDPQPTDNLWNLVPGDEMDWLFNESVTQNGVKIGSNLGLLQSKVVEIADTLLDEDNITDLTILNKIIYGTEKVNFGIPLYITGIEDIARILLYGAIATGNPNSLNLLFNTLLGETPSLNPSIDFPLSIPSPAKITLSDFPSFLKNAINYVNRSGVTIFNNNLPYFDYELVGIDGIYSERFGTYLHHATTDSNRISVGFMPEKEWARGLIFDITDSGALNAENPASYLSVMHNASIYSEIDWENSSSDPNRFGMTLRLFASPNASLLVDITGPILPLSFTDRLDGASQHWLIENESIYVLQKNEISIYNVGLLENEYFTNPDAGKWTYLAPVPVNQWINLTIDSPLTTYGRMRWVSNQTGYVQVNENEQIAYNITGHFGNPTYLDEPRIMISAIRANDTCKVYLDYITPEKLEGYLWEPSGFIPEVGSKMSFGDPLRWLSLVNLNSLFILPEDFDYDFIASALDTILFGPLRSQLPYGADMPEIINTAETFEIHISTEAIEDIINALNGDDADIIINFELSPGSVDLRIIFDKSIDILRSFILEMTYEPINARRLIRLDLVKTLSREMTASSYSAWNSSIFLPSSSRKQFTKEVEITSRFVGDAFPDKVDPSKFSVDFTLLLMEILDEIDIGVVLLAAFNQNPVEYILAVIGIMAVPVTISALFISKYRKHHPR